MAEAGDAGQQEPERFGIGRLFWMTSEAIIAADLDTERIVLWNPAAARLFGYTADEALGMPLEQLVPEDVRSQHLEGLRRYREGAGGAGTLVGQGAVDLPGRTKTGERRDIALSLTDVSTSDPASSGGGARRVLAVVRDVTAEREVERKLQRTNDAMRDFVAAASHDLRAPLTRVFGFARTLRDHGDLLGDEDRAASIDAILRGAEHATRLVDDLLTLSQLQAGVLATVPGTVELSAAAEDAVRQSGVAASTAGVAPGLAVLVDGVHLERMLVNFLVNAGRYGRPPVRVTADGAPDGASAVVRVWDDGDGVPDAFHARLFTPFARADPSRRDGTGLGLSIVRGLAEANGGEVSYERLDGSTAFGVRLPLA